MTKVFIGGSRASSRLNPEIRKRLDNIMANGFPIVVGDASGADKAVQQYLSGKNYRNVEVFCSGNKCRNNLGQWQTRNIQTSTRSRTAQFYAVKDRVMAQEATIGLMVWDGKSVGTVLNLFRLLSQNKKAVLYATPEKRFFELKRWTDWQVFIANQDVDFQNKIEQRTKLEPVEHTTTEPSHTTPWITNEHAEEREVDSKTVRDA